MNGHPSPAVLNRLERLRWPNDVTTKPNATLTQHTTRYAPRDAKFNIFRSGIPQPLLLFGTARPLQSNLEWPMS